MLPSEENEAQEEWMAGVIEGEYLGLSQGGWTSKYRKIPNVLGSADIWNPMGQRVFSAQTYVLIGHKGQIALFFKLSSLLLTFLSMALKSVKLI